MDIYGGSIALEALLPHLLHLPLPLCHNTCMGAKREAWRVTQKTLQGGKETSIHSIKNKNDDNR